MVNIRLYLGNQEGNERMFVEFASHALINEIIKGIPGSRWNQQKKLWHLAASNEVYKVLKARTSGIAVLDTSQLREQVSRKKAAQYKISGLDGATVVQLEAFEKWMVQKRYSPETVRNYLNQLRQFFIYCLPRSHGEITENDVERFNHEIVFGHGLSVSYQRGLVGAVKLFYRHYTDHVMKIDWLQRPFKEQRLPEVLSKEEVKRVLKATDNLKHKSLLSLIYSCGLRIGEALKLKLKDLDKERRLIRIEQAKGKKDRYVPYSEKIMQLLRAYYGVFKPKVYLFEGQFGGQYSERSAALVLKGCLKKCRISKRVTLHTLRHSYATHLLEGGTDIRYIQEILGHSSPKTTMIYTHVSSRKLSEIPSPFDDLDI